jgi:hypothetical protein
MSLLWRMKRFYFMHHHGRVFAVEPQTMTLLTATQDEAGQTRLVRATLDTLGIPAGRRYVRRAPLWRYAPLRALIESELNKHKVKGQLRETVYPYSTRPTKPVVAFLAREPWTEEQNKAWLEERRIANTRKKHQQRANRQATKKRKLSEGWVDSSIDEESE